MKKTGLLILLALPLMAVADSVSDAQAILDQSGVTVTASDTTLLLMQVVFGAADADTINLWVDPDVNSPGAADASSSYTDASFDMIGFSSAAGTLAASFDECRIGDTMEDVVGGGGPVPQAGSLFVIK